MSNSPDAATVVGVLAVGVPAFFVFCGALLRASKLRGDVSFEWSSRIDLAESKLGGKAINELQQLRDETVKLLGGPHDDVDPSMLATADPDPLLARAKTASKIYGARRQMTKSQNGLVMIAPWQMGFLVGAIIADVLLTLFYTDIVGREGIQIAGFIFAAMSAVPLLALFSIEVVLRSRMSSSEALAHKRPSLR